MNRNKKSITLDIKQPEGKEVFKGNAPLHCKSQREVLIEHSRDDK
jgi:crotonobetainyl-CoA:carnitine CoA-transferase CaiB-like acyl-CoA transferase